MPKAIPRRFATRTAFALVAAALFTSTLSAQPRLTTWRATQVWAVDGTEDGEPFASPLDFLILADGTLWLLDNKDQVIRRYSASGRPLGVVGRKGSGPGEMRNANGMAIASDRTIWVNDYANGRITIFNENGTFNRQITHSPGGYAWRWNAWFDTRTGELYEAAIGKSINGWQRINSKGESLGITPYGNCASGRKAPGSIRAESSKNELFMSYPFTIGGGSAPTGDGTVWCAATWGTRVALIRLGSTDTLARTSIEVPNAPISREEMDKEIRQVDSAVAKYTLNDFDKSKIPPAKPGIAWLHVDADKRLWVQHTSTVNATTTVFDVHSTTGAHVARVTIPARIRNYSQLRARGDNVWALIVDEDDVPKVAQFRIHKASR